MLIRTHDPVAGELVLIANGKIVGQCASIDTEAKTYEVVVKDVKGNLVLDGENVKTKIIKGDFILAKIVCDTLEEDRNDEMCINRYSLLQDGSGHDYLIPVELKPKFSRLMETMESIDEIGDEYKKAESEWEAADFDCMRLKYHFSRYSFSGVKEEN